MGCVITWRAIEFYSARTDAKAIKDCDFTVHENPADESALPIKALAHLHEGLGTEAVAAFEKIKDPKTVENIVRIWGMAYIAANNPKRAIGQLLFLLTQ